MNRPIPQKVLTILLVIVCVVFNLVIQTFPFRIDLSNGRAYSVSQASKNIVAKLKKPVRITFFVSRTIPSQLQSVRTEIDTFLTEYAAQAGGKNVIYKQRDPEVDEAAQKELQKYSIPQLQFSQQDQDAFSLQNAYFGVGVEYDGKRASLPQVTDVRDLEYNLTAILYTLGKTNLPTVGIYGLENATAQLQSIMSASRLQFTVQEASAIDATSKAMMIFADGSKEYTDQEISDIDRYVMSGGSAIFFVDGVSVNTELSATPANHHLFDLLQKMGVTVKQELVLSQASELVTFGQGQNAFPTVLQYPYWIKTNEFAKDTKLSNISVLVFPWTAPIRTNNNATTLASTEAQSWTQSSDFTIRPDLASQARPRAFASYPLVAETRYGNGTVMVIPSSKFIQDVYLSRSNDNLELVLNTLNEYASEGALTGIRRRSVEYYPLPALEITTKNILKYLQVGLGSVVVAVIGIVVLLRRSRSQR